MASLNLFLPPNGSIALSKVVATYPIVVYHSSLVVECKEVVVAIIGYATKIPLPLFPSIYNLLELYVRF
jgi:hypothetical protein